MGDVYFIYLEKRHLKSINEYQGYLLKQNHPLKIAVIAIYPSDESIVFTKNLLNAFVDNDFYIVVLSTRKMKDSERAVILARSHYLIERYNIGQDLGSYKHGLYWLEKKGNKLSSAELLVLANDSMFYPANFTHVLKSMIDREECWQCLFENYQHSHHAQSFFLLFRKEVFECLDVFWKKYKPYRSRLHAIFKGEIALSQYLFSNEFFPEAYYNSITVYNTLYEKILSEDMNDLPITLFIIKFIDQAVLKKNVLSLQRNVFITYILDKISILMHTHNPTHSVGLILARIMGAPLKRDFCYPGIYRPDDVVRNVTAYHEDELLAMRMDLDKKGIIRHMPTWRDCVIAGVNLAMDITNLILKSAQKISKKVKIFNKTHIADDANNNQDPSIIITVERSWTDNDSVGLYGWALSKNNDLEYLSITIDDVSLPIHTWYPRPDVNKIYPAFPVREKCGFFVCIPRKIKHNAIFKTNTINDIEIPVSFYGLNDMLPSDYTPDSTDYFNEFVTFSNKNRLNVLEIGSRIVSPGSVSKRSFFPDAASYTGFDYYPDANTDVVGDAHRLSQYFDNHKKFDAIYSFSVFEHLAMPWVVAKEINKLLTLGGVTFHKTHFAWPRHEAPWDFWRFSDDGLRILFSKATGFEVIKAGIGMPLRMHFDHISAEHETFSFNPGFGSAWILAKKVSEIDHDKLRWDYTIEDILADDHRYPINK